MSQPSNYPQDLIISAYGPKFSVGLLCTELPYGRTKQSFKDESDINNIVKKFMKTGTIEFSQRNEPRYGDVTGADFQTYNNIIAAANTMFAELPAALRTRFENDPAKFFDFVQDEGNRAEAQELGLLKPATVAAEPMAVRVVSPSHLEDGSATHEPLRARDGTFREHTRKEQRAEAAQQKAADAAKTNSST